MFLAVLLFCKKFPDIVALNLAFQRGVTTLEELVKAIAAATKGQGETNRAGEQTVKDNAKATLLYLIAKICTLLSGYAADKEDAALEAKVTFTQRDLDRLQEAELTELANTVQEIASPIVKSDGPDFGITRQLLTDLEVAAGAYAEAKDEPRIATTTGSTYTKTLAGAMSVASTHLRRKLDKFVVAYEESHPEFFMGYWESRKVLDVGVRKKKEVPKA